MDDNSHWPGRHLQWASAEWGARVFEQGCLVSFVGIVLRDAKHNGKPIRLGGVGGVKTHPASQRKGFATLGMQCAIDFFREQPNVGFALLVCEPPLIEFYSNQHWQVFEGRLMTEQHGVTVEFTFNRVMVRDVHAEAPTTGIIDLQGRPW